MVLPSSLLEVVQRSCSMRVVRVPRGSRITSLILKLQRISELLASSKIQFGLREGLGMTYNRMMGYRRDTISPTLIVVP